MKKIKFIIFAGATFLGLVTSTNAVLAASQSVYAHYKVHGSGNGISSGKSNGVWHYLNKNRTVTLKVTSSFGSGSGSCTLRRNMFGFDKSYGTVSSNKGTHHFGTNLTRKKD